MIDPVINGPRPSIPIDKEDNEPPVKALTKPKN